MDQMHAYPGRTMGQLYHRFFRVNELAEGTLDLGDEDGEIRPRRRARARCCRSPVRRTCSRRGRPSTTSPSCCRTRRRSGSRRRPGGHLGVLTGRGAARSTWAWIDDFFADGDAGSATAPARRRLGARISRRLTHPLRGACIRTAPSRWRHSSTIFRSGRISGCARPAPRLPPLPWTAAMRRLSRLFAAVFVCAGADASLAVPAAHAQNPPPPRRGSPRTSSRAASTCRA